MASAEKAKTPESEVRRHLTAAKSANDRRKMELQAELSRVVDEGRKIAGI